MQRDDDVYAGSAFNSFPLRPKVLNLFITERCNAECTMCVTNSHPHISRQTDIIESQAVEWLRQTAAIESIKAVCFVGGEALLRLGVVERLSAQCKAQGLVTSVVTNGFWAKTPELARKVLSRLHNAGLVRITLSSDVFHTDYIPLDRISNAITVAKELGIRCNLNCVLTRDSWGIEYLREHLANFDYLDKIAEFSCLPVGRGKQIKNLILQPTVPDRRCPFVISTLTIKSNGEVYACCGVGGFTPPLNLGNISSRALSEIVASAERMPLIQILAIHGPKYMATLLEKSGQWQTGQYVDECHLCHTLLDNPRLFELLDDSLKSQARLLDMKYNALFQVRRIG